MGSAGAGGDDKRTSRADQRGTHRFDGAPIRFAVRLELREVVDKGGVDYPIRRGGTVAQTIQILQRTSMNLRARGDQRRCGSIRARQAEDLMPYSNQIINDGRTNKPTRTGNKDTHS